MSNFVRFRHLAIVCFCVVIAAICTVSPVNAQTAPQLLPYTVKLIAGGGTTAIASGATCPVSGYTSTDAYGDGCLATEIELTAPRYAISDTKGNIFFSDYVNGLVRRIDASSGIVTVVAGGATSSPASGVACGTNVSTDAKGDGCLGTAVKLSHPTGLVFSPAGDLYFGDYGYANVRKIAATAGFITTTGVITMVDGNPSGSYGYTSGVVATSGYLDGPFGLAFDANGNLYIAEEAKNAIMVVNTNATSSTTVTGITIPATEVVKIVGSPTAGGTVCPNSPASTNGCNYGAYSSPAVANSSQTDSPYGVAFDLSGNVYFANEYENSVAKVNSTGTLTNYAGNYPLSGTGTKEAQTKRGAAGSFGIGSDFGITADANGNVYVTDALNGYVWRIDGATQSMYVVAGGAASVCSTNTDTYGDGCPGLQATFGKSGTSYATSSSPGIFGITVDAYSDLFVGDTITNLVREISSGTQFGSIGNTQPTQIVDIHFAAGDTPAANAYTLTAGASNFVLGTASCTYNSDTTTDCLLPLQATPTVLGPFSGTLTVKSTLGATANFPLSGTLVVSPFTRTAVSVTSSTNCGTTSTFATTTPITLTATINSTGTPTGTVTFYANGTQIGTPQAVNSSVASLTYTFSTIGTYTITATYSGDSYFKTSTGTAPTKITTSAPTFTTSAVAYSQSSVYPGGTGLYSFNLVQSVYTGTVTFSCSGLPANSSCTFNPSSVAGAGCSATNTIAVSIVTAQGSAVLPASFGGSGSLPWTSLAAIPGLALALFIGLRRRRMPMRFGQLWMVVALLLAASGLVACSTKSAGPQTPAGSYTVTVTATGTDGTKASFTVPLTVI